MIGEMIKEYLVGLGVQIDKPGFNELDTTIKTTSNTIQSATGAWAANFVKAGSIMATSLASITTAVGGLMVATANQDLAMEKYARSMMLSKDAAWEMKKATDALGESVADIVITPELMDRYKALVNDGKQMKVGGDFSQTMKSFRDLMFEFTRLKQEVSYAMSWVGYYLLKYLNKPLQEAKENFKSFNDSFIRNMSTWTEKAARYLVYIINIAIHFWDLIKGVTKGVYELWSAFPKGIKIATAALAGFFLLLRASPLSRMIMLVSTLLLLIDDYFGYMEGKQAQFGKYWDILNKFIDITKTKIIEFAHAAEPIWETFVNYLILAKDKVIAFKYYVTALAEQISNSKEFNDFVATIKRLAIAFWNLSGGVIDTVISLIKMFYEAMTDNGTVKSFSEMMSNLWHIFLGLLNAIAESIEVITEWLSEAMRSEIVRELVDAIVELFNAFLELNNAIFYLVKEILTAFFGGMQNTEPVFSFRDAVRAVVKVIIIMIRLVATIIQYLAKFFKMMADNRLFREFWEGLGKAVKTFGDIISNVITGALEKIGKLGKALLALVKGDFKGAIKIMGGSNSGSDAVGEASAEATSERAQYIYKRLIEKGYTPEQAAGIVGNLVQESNLNTTARSRDGYNSVGIGQWTGDREQGLYNFAKENGRDPFDLDTQIDYLDYELHNDESFARETLLNNSSTPEEAAITFSTGTNGKGHGGFERPDPEAANNAGRAANARELYDLMTSQTYTDTNNSTTITTNAPPAYWSNIIEANLFEKLTDLMRDFNKWGYYATYKGAGTNWAGFQLTGNPDLQNVKDMAAQYGLEVSQDENGFYVSLNGKPSVNDVESEESLLDKAKRKIGGLFGSGFMQGANVDPYLYRGLMTGGYSASFAGNNNISYHVNVGGVTVNNTNASPEEIGEQVGQYTASALDEQAQYMYQSRVLTGSPEQ